MPLPDGATLVTFQDVTDSVNVERVLTERNEALVAGRQDQDRLRPPRLLRAALAAHQHHRLRAFPRRSVDRPAHRPSRTEYLGYITASSNALLAIINNILDLASIGAGAMTLDLEPVDIRATMDAAAEGVQDRLVKNNIRLELNAPADIGSFVADERRVRQILFNLLSNAVGFSPPGETVVLTARAHAGRGDRSR